MGSNCEFSDYISNLPEIPIEKILMCLPLKDAARTSVLSSVWRFNWRKLPALVFDNRFCNPARTRSSTQLIMIIYQVLLAHNGPIHNFVLDITGVQSCSEVDQILRYVFSKGIQDFTFHIHRGVPQRLPLSLFSCQELTHLDLCFCHFTPPSSFKGFPNLVSLKLSQVFGTTNKTLENLISNSPKLEHLALETSAIWDSLEVVSHSLKYFYLRAFCKSISFKNSTALATISICSTHTYDERRKPTIFRSFGSIPIISSLHLDRHYMQLSVTGLHPGTLMHIKDLKLSDIQLGMETDINNVLMFISYCPNLKTVTIEVCPFGNDAGDSLKEFYESLWKRNFSFFSAPQVKIRRVRNLGHELEFIEILLAKLPELEKMHIEPLTEMVVENLNILKRVTQFKRASPKAVIKFDNHVS